jgi:hypothetical protein
VTLVPTPLVRALRLVAIAGLLAPAAAAAQLRTTRRALPLDPDGSVRVFLLGGDVRIVGGGVDSVIVVAAVPAGQTLHMGGGARGVKLGVWDESAVGPVPPSRLEVRVPTRSRVWVKVGQSAEVDASGITGGLDVNIVAGRVRVRGAPRELNVEAMDGSIDVTGAPAWLRAKTASGAITLAGGGEDVALSSVSGAIRVSGARVTRGRFESVTGDVRFEGAADRAGSLTFDTHSGTTELRLARDAGAEIEVTTILGAIDNALSDARPVTGRQARGQALSFAIGDSPTAAITVRSFKGRVLLRRSR